MVNGDKEIVNLEYSVSFLIFKYVIVKGKLSSYFLIIFFNFSLLNSFSVITTDLLYLDLIYL